MNLTPRYTEEDLESAKQQGRDEMRALSDGAWMRGYNHAGGIADMLISRATHRGFWWGFAAGAALATIVVAVWVAGGAA